MAAKSYVLGFARRPLTAYGADWRLTCMLCDGRCRRWRTACAARETTPEGKPGIRVTYRLRADARWGDGTPVSAEDLRFAWEAGRDAATGFGGTEFYRSAYELRSSRMRRTVTLRFDKVTFDFASLGDFQPLPAHVERPAGSRTRAATATAPPTTPRRPTPALWSGPYRITAVQPGAGVTLERNPTWQGAAARLPPHHRSAPSRTPRRWRRSCWPAQLDMVAGELGLPVEQARRWNAAPAALPLAYKPGLIYEHLDLQLDNPVLADVRVRQALLSRLDRAQIVAAAFRGPADRRATPASTRSTRCTTTTVPAHGTSTRPAPRALLEEAGWTRGPDGIRRNAAGERLTIELMTTAGNRAREAVQQVLQGMWRRPASRRGSATSRRACSSARPCRSASSRALAMFAWISAPENVPRSNPAFRGDPDRGAQLVRPELPAASATPEMDALLEAIPQELDRDKRRALWSRLQAIYAGTCRPCRSGSAPTRMSGRNGWRMCGRPATCTRPRSGWRSGG